jgi:hypothetical protein
MLARAGALRLDRRPELEVERTVTPWRTLAITATYQDERRRSNEADKPDVAHQVVLALGRTR